MARWQNWEAEERRPSTGFQAAMPKTIVTATPTAFELGPEAAPVLPSWVLNGSPVTKSKNLVRSHDWNSNIVIWECTAGQFNWHYHKDEVVVVVAGEVFVTNERGEERRLGPGDLAFFPSGSSSTWRVPICVRKIAILRETMWQPLGVAFKVWKKLLRMAGVGGESPL
jgi:uncharacterized cupin superfamily protein